MTEGDTLVSFRHRHLLGIEGLSPPEISLILDRSESYVEQNRRADKKQSLLRGRTIINLFFEASTRTSTSFELAGKRLGADFRCHVVPCRRDRIGHAVKGLLVVAQHPVPVPLTACCGVASDWVVLRGGSYRGVSSASSSASRSRAMDA